MSPRYSAHGVIDTLCRRGVKEIAMEMRSESEKPSRAYSLCIGLEVEQGIGVTTIVTPIDRY